MVPVHDDPGGVLDDDRGGERVQQSGLDLAGDLFDAAFGDVVATDGDSAHRLVI